MKRRTLITAIGTTGVSVPGCLNDGSGEDRETPTETPTETAERAESKYTECNAPFIDYEELPTDLTDEVDIAFDEGEYVSDEEPLFSQAVSDGTPLWKNDAPYLQKLERDGESYRLSFVEQTAYPSSRAIYLATETEEASVSLTVTTETGDRIVEEEDISLVPDEEERIQGPREFGEYEVTVEVGAERRETAKWELYPHRIERVDGLVISITRDEIGIEPLISVFDYEPCSMQWD